MHSIKEIDGNRVIVGGANVIPIINISNDIIEQQIKNDKIFNIVAFMILRDGNILCGCKDGLICKYDIKLNKLEIKNYKIHNDIISCLLIRNKNQFISC